MPKLFCFYFWRTVFDIFCNIVKLFIFNAFLLRYPLFYFNISTHVFIRTSNNWNNTHTQTKTISSPGVFANDCPHPDSDVTEHLMGIKGVRKQATIIFTSSLKGLCYNSNQVFDSADIFQLTCLSIISLNQELWSNLNPWLCFLRGRQPVIRALISSSHKRCLRSAVSLSSVLDEHCSLRSCR